MPIDVAIYLRHRATVEALRAGVVTLAAQESDLRMRASVHWARTHGELPLAMREMPPVQVVARLTSDAEEANLNPETRMRILGLLSAVREYRTAEATVVEIQREKAALEARYRPLATLQTRLDRYAAEQGVQL